MRVMGSCFLCLMLNQIDNMFWKHERNRIAGYSGEDYSLENK
jgi:hypothetical protein